MFRRIAAITTLVAAVVTAAAAVAAEEAPPQRERPSFELSADSVEFESARRIYLARGNVRITSKDTVLSADWMVFSDVEGRGVATGHVVYRADGDELHATFVEFDIDSERGILFDARFEPRKGEFRLEGDTIVRHGEDRYSFENGVFTTCMCPEGEREPWRIEAEQADLEVGGYAKVRNTTFEVLGFPVVWLPWMIYPVKTERESGLLFPSLGYSDRNGFDVGLPIFWAARDELNVTVTPHWLSERGFKTNVDLEYVYGAESEGELSGAFLYDELIDPSSRRDPFGRARWFLYGKQDAHLPGGLHGRSKFQFISDNEYLSDFGDLPADEDDRFLESTAFVGRPFGESGRFGGLAAIAYYDDLQNPDDQDRDRFLLQRLPSVSATAMPAPADESNPLLSRIVPSFDFEYTYFVPRRRAVDKYDGLSGAYYVGDTFIDTGIDALPSSSERRFPGDPDPHDDDTTATTSGFELNGTFEEGEPLADDGSRAVFFPRLGAPFRIGNFVEAYPEIGWHETVYDTHFQGSDERHLLTTRLDLRSRFVRHYDDWTHVVEPRLGYAFVSDLGQDQNDAPLFVPKTAVPQRRLRQLELTNVTLDAADRVSRFNGMTLGIGNRIYGEDESGVSDLLADFYLSNQLHLDSGRFGDIFVGGRFYPIENTFLWLDLGFDPEASVVSEVILQLAYNAEVGHALRIGYRYLRDVPRFYEDFESSSDRFEEFTESYTRINQIQVFSRVALTDQWFAHYRGTYTFEDSRLLKNRAGIEYVSKCSCWAAGFEVGYRRARGLSFNLTYRLLGLGRAYEGVGLARSGLLDGL